MVISIVMNELKRITGELGYDRPLYDRFLHMTDDMLSPSPMHIKYLSYVYDRFLHMTDDMVGPSPMHIKYSSYVYDGFCIWRTNFPGHIESVISKFTCICSNLSSKWIICLNLVTAICFEITFIFKDSGSKCCPYSLLVKAAVYSSLSLCIPASKTPATSVSWIKDQPCLSFRELLLVRGN